MRFASFYGVMCGLTRSSVIKYPIWLSSAKRILNWLRMRLVYPYMEIAPFSPWPFLRTLSSMVSRCLHFVKFPYGRSYLVAFLVLHYWQVLFLLFGDADFFAESRFTMPNPSHRDQSSLPPSCNCGFKRLLTIQALNTYQ